MRFLFSQRHDSHRAAIHIALIYLASGMLWVVLSDHLLARWIQDERTLTLLQTYKGWLFISATAALVYGLVYLYVRRLLASQAALRRAEEQARQREAELAHASRLIMLGELASGLAHELTQPLGAILSYGETGQEILRKSGGKDVAEADDSGSQSSGLEAMDAVVAQARRAQEIVQRLREFARKQTPQPTEVDVNRLVRDSLSLLAHEARRQGVQVSTALGANLPTVQADPVQLQQVLVNLGSNAIEAAAAQPKGSRRVTWRTQCDDDRVVVRVRDSGSGVSPGADQHLFESFFTTKATGLGLGLPISRSIVESHGGHLRHQREDGWTEFRFHLPLPMDTPCSARNTPSSG